MSRMDMSLDDIIRKGGGGGGGETVGGSVWDETKPHVLLWRMCAGQKRLENVLNMFQTEIIVSTWLQIMIYLGILHLMEFKCYPPKKFEIPLKSRHEICLTNLQIPFGRHGCY